MYVMPFSPLQWRTHHSCFVLFRFLFSSLSLRLFAGGRSQGQSVVLYNKVMVLEIDGKLCGRWPEKRFISCASSPF